MLREEFQLFVERLKCKMSRLQRGSKEYWKLVKKLLLGSRNRLSVPCLVKGDKFANTGFEKATFFAETFAEKWQVPER